MKYPKEYYPTPEALANKMVSLCELDYVYSVLEPSAGDGNLIKALKNYTVSGKRHYSESRYEVDAIELEEDFHPILASLDAVVVYNDFLHFNTCKKYDLILMNPPFSNGEQHLLKALDMQEHGGQICCLLSAETLKNPYTSARKKLLRKLENLNANIEYISGAFSNAERQTDVEVALIYVSIPDSYEDSDILKNLREAEILEEDISEETQLSTELTAMFKVLTRQYDNEVKAGLKLISEMNALQKTITSSFSETHSRPLFVLTINGKSDIKNMRNYYVSCVRYKYWEALFY